MNRLLEIGFERCGRWLLENEKLRFELNRNATQSNILYAFVSDGQVKYVGKTVLPLKIRMSGYKSPGKSQSTNINNHGRIRKLLSHGATVEILALPDNGLLHFGQFHLNLAAALEDDIINKVDPEWNGGKVEEVPSPAAVPLDAISHVLGPFNPTFSFTLQPRYYERGFFNVGIGAQAELGSDGAPIELFLGENQTPVWGTINRTANANQTPRIMVGKGLRDWFKNYGAVGAEISVEVFSPTSIRLKCMQQVH